MKPRAGQKGAAIVEFAVLLILLMVFVFGIIEFGFIWVQSHYIANAAREGARVAAKQDDPKGADLTVVYNSVKDYLEGAIVYNPTFVSNCCDSADNYIFIDVTDETIVSSNDAVRVTVSVQTDQVWEPVLWALLNLIPGTDLGEIRRVTETAVFAKLNP